MENQWKTNGKPMENQWKINENPLLIRKCLNKIFDDQKKVFFKTKIFGTYILAEVLKNEFLWQSDKVRGHQSTVYRSRKFAKNQENTYALGHENHWAPSYTGLLRGNL